MTNTAQQRIWTGPIQDISLGINPNKKFYDLLFYVPVTSYGHVWTVSSLNKA